MKKYLGILLLIIISFIGMKDVEAKSVYKNCYYVKDNLDLTLEMYDDYTFKAYVKKVGDYTSSGKGNEEGLQDYSASSSDPLFTYIKTHNDACPPYAGAIETCWAGICNLDVFASTSSGLSLIATGLSYVGGDGKNNAVSAKTGEEVVNAASTPTTPTDSANVCSDEKNSSCAYCVYNYAAGTGCYGTLAVTYKSDNTPLTYAFLKQGSNTGYVSCTFAHSGFVKGAFVTSDGKAQCPKVKVVSTITSSSGRTAYTKVTFTYDPNGTTTFDPAYSTITQKEDKIDPSGGEESKYCYYDKGACGPFRVSLIDGKAVVTPDTVLSGFQYGTGQLDSTKFENGNCPEVFTHKNTREVNICSYSTTYQGQFTSAGEGSEVDSNTGQETGNHGSGNNGGGTGSFSKIDNSSSGDTCNSVLGPDATDWLNKIFMGVKIIAPLLLIAYSMVDYGKAITSGDDDAKAKATKTVVKRFIVAIIIFLLPTLLKFIMTVTGLIGDCSIN